MGSKGMMGRNWMIGHDVMMRNLGMTQRSFSAAPLRHSRKQFTYGAIKISLRAVLAHSLSVWRGISTSVRPERR